MKKTLKLLGLLLALCLLLSQFSLPALAESAHYTAPPLAESSYLEEFVKTGGWPPELIGSWVGFYVNTWGCWTFYPDGRHVLTVFDFPAYNMAGTSKTLAPAAEMSFETTEEGDFWHLTDNGQGDLRKVSMPYVRLKAEKETAAAGVDPALIGTFGGRLNGVYTEWTFHGDRRFTQVIPYEELSENGTFLAGDGALAILLNGKIIKCAYKAWPMGLALELPDISQGFMKRGGPLVQIPNQWRIDTLELAKPAYREEFASTGGIPPENIGTWVGMDWQGQDCGQFTFYRDGRYDMTIFNNPSMNRTGTSKTLEPADNATAEGDILHLEDYGSKTDARRISMPYARMKAEEETAAAGIDPAILGTFSGRLSGKYVEWTFHGDGRLTQVIPYEESTKNGTFVTGGGELAVLIDGKVIQCAYTASPNKLVLELPELDRKMMTRKGGQLVQIPAQWN